MARKTLIHKHTNQTTTTGGVLSPKLPTVGTLEKGEIAVNYKDGYETLSIENDLGEVVPFASLEQIMSYVDNSLPDLELSSNYSTSDLENENLQLAEGDSYEEAFSKLEKAILDNEETIATSLNDLNTRKIEIDDIPTKTSQLTNDSGFLTSHQLLKTINNESLIGSGNITIQGGGGDTNIIETVKVNGTALTPDANKAVDIKAGNETISNTLNLGTLVSDTYINQNNGQEVTYTGWSSTDYIALNDDVIQIKSSKSLPYSALYDSNKNFLSVIKLNYKFINIEDAKYIRISGSNSDMNSVVVTTKSTSNVDIWIPAKTSDLTNDSGFLTSAPVTSVNGQTGAVTLTIPDAVTESTVSGWGFTKNTGTITGITMNGSSKGTSGVVNLGTVLTEHQTLKTINSESIVGTGNLTVSGLPTVTASDNGKVLQVVNGAWSLVMPTAIYSGTSTPNNSVGNDGDLYLLTS